MRMPSPPYSRLDLAPPSADRFIFGVAPLDYGPVLLRRPSGFRLTADTLPSGNCKRWLQVRLGCVRLSSLCPFRLLHTFLSPGQRGVIPAFGYGAPHSSAGGTSTLPIWALPSAHYDEVRLLVSVHHRLRLLTFPMRTAVHKQRRRRPDTRPPRFRCDPFARDVAFDPGRASAPRITVPHMLPSSE